MDGPTNHSFNQLAGRRLKAVRKFHRLTQEACAEICGITISAWNKWEKGVNPIDPELVAPFIRTHQGTLDWVFYSRNVKLGSGTISALEMQFEK